LRAREIVVLDHNIDAQPCPGRALFLEIRWRLWSLYAGLSSRRCAPRLPNDPIDRPWQSQALACSMQPAQLHDPLIFRRCAVENCRNIPRTDVGSGLPRLLIRLCRKWMPDTNRQVHYWGTALQ
jgi:hypothetical protein